MSEDEKDVIEFLKMCGKTQINSFTVKRKHINKIVKAIDKLEKENEELQKENENLTLSQLDITKAREKNFISKDKIRDKIKELEEIKQDDNNKLADKAKFTIVELLELLEEE